MLGLIYVMLRLKHSVFQLSCMQTKTKKLLWPLENSLRISNQIRCAFWTQFWIRKTTPVKYWPVNNGPFHTAKKNLLLAEEYSSKNSTILVTSAESTPAYSSLVGVLQKSNKARKSIYIKSQLGSKRKPYPQKYTGMSPAFLCSFFLCWCSVRTRKK